jgi:hypothetical protein
MKRLLLILMLLECLIFVSNKFEGSTINPTITIEAQDQIKKAVISQSDVLARMTIEGTTSLILGLMKRLLLILMLLECLIFVSNKFDGSANMSKTAKKLINMFLTLNHQTYSRQR